VGKQHSTLRPPKTVTICNYTTPKDTGEIVEINIYLRGAPEGSMATAVIYSNNPELQQPSELLAKSTTSLNITSETGEWYSFPMNFLADQNTCYWIGYYSESYTRYFYDSNDTSISATSQPTDELPTSFPNSMNYDNKSTMSLYAIYNKAEPKLTVIPATTENPTPQQTKGLQETLPVLLIIGTESAILIGYQIRKKKLTTQKH